MKKSIIALLLLFPVFVSCNKQKQQAEQPPQQQQRPHHEFDETYPDVHDPVLAVGEDGRYYIFSTGFGVGVMSSSDLKIWRQEPPVFGRDQIPQWATDSVPGYHGHTWAPDISYRNGLWHLYYSCSTFGKNGSAIGLATNKTLDPKSPDFKWQDQGAVVVSHKKVDNWNAIDPNLIENYLTWGSFWDGIQLQKLDKDLKTRLGEPKTIARRISRHRELKEIEFTVEGKDTIEAGDNAIEAPFIIKRGDWYYLFVSHDYCCRGKASTYKTAYGRSKVITGPYLDKEGKDMAFGGGTLLVGPDERYYGVGHCSAYELKDGQWYFISHAYDSEFGARAKLFIRKMIFDKDGWFTLEEK